MSMLQNAVCKLPISSLLQLLVEVMYMISFGKPLLPRLHVQKYAVFSHGKPKEN